jgi:2-desacetyl-2-hydroxyethyl bacteriochlorophyllide A dehydrogenase
VSGALPSTMPAAVYQGDRTIAVEQRPLPAPGPTDVLLEVSHCGICGSDLHLIVEGWGQQGAISGHEWSGRVVAVGDDVDSWQVGDLAIGGPDPKCGECEYCRAGRSVLCNGRTPPGVGSTDHQGAFAGYKVANQRSILRVPDGMELRVAALTEPLAVALHGITRSGAKAGDRVLVTGAGPIGLLTVAALKAMGVDDIVVSEPGESRRALAAAVGAAATVTPEALTIPDFPMTIVDEPFDVALDCSGHPGAIEAALAQLRPAGSMCLVGAGVKSPRWSPTRILLNELVITGAYCYDDDGFDKAIELLASGRLPTDLLIESQDVPLDDIEDAMRRLLSGELAAKVMIVPQ